MDAAPLAREVVDDIPVRYITPDPSLDRRRLALFLPFLGGTTADVAPQLRRLAAAGLTAVSFDPWRLGERGGGDDDAVVADVFTHFRLRMWPMLGRTTLDAVHVLDWACDRFDVEASDVRAGGVSMGGDIAVSHAGIDRRVVRVGAIVAGPDWTRPGMTPVRDPGRVVEQGEPSALGAWLFEHLDPATHPERYVGGAAIAFELGADDTHVPPAAAVAFRERIVALDPAASDRMRVTLHPGLDHAAAARDARVIDAALHWICA